MRQIFRTFLSCKSEKLYPLNSNSLFSPLVAPDNHHSTFSFYEVDHCHINAIIYYSKCVHIYLSQFFLGQESRHSESSLCLESQAIVRIVTRDEFSSDACLGKLPCSCRTHSRSLLQSQQWRERLEQVCKQQGLEQCTSLQSSISPLWPDWIS